MDIPVLAIWSIVWGGALVGVAMALQGATRISGAARQALWRIVAVLIVSPWIIAPVADWAGIGLPAPPVAIVEQAPIVEPVPVIVDEPVFAPVVTSIEPVVPEIQIPWFAVLIGAIVAGWLWRMVAARVAATSLARIVAKASDASEGPARQSLATWSRRLGFKRTPRLLIVAEGLSPFSFGATRPVICLPQGLDRKLGAEALDLVIGHECLHVARGDGWMRPVERLVADLIWFNPFAWRIRRELDVARELACDEAVLKHAQAHRAYARTLRNVAGITAGLDFAAPAASMSLAGSPRSLMLRVTRALSGAKSKPARTALVGIALVALAGVPVACMQGVAAAPRVAAKAEPEPDPVFASEETEIVVPPTAIPVSARSDLRLDGETNPILRTKSIVVDRYGYRTDVFTGRTSFHSGTDIAAYSGAPIYAPAAGVVSFAGIRGAYSKVVELDMGGDATMRFGYLSALNVRTGDHVKAGDTIGAMGSSGRSVAPHVHLEYIVDGKMYDPSLVENLKFGTPLIEPHIPSAPSGLVPTRLIQTPQDAKTSTGRVLRLNGDTYPLVDGAGHLKSGFGYRTDPFTGKIAFHEGVDLEAYWGAPIHAPVDGTITYSGVRGSYGRVVDLDIGGGAKISFGHLNTIKVEKDVQVKAGDVIGTMGSTGRSTGPHVHFEYYLNGKAYDPLEVENLKFATTLDAPPVPPLAPVPPTAPAPEAPPALEAPQAVPLEAPRAVPVPRPAPLAAPTLEAPPAPPVPETAPAPRVPRPLQAPPPPEPTSGSVGTNAQLIPAQFTVAPIVEPNAYAALVSLQARNAQRYGDQNPEMIATNLAVQSARNSISERYKDKARSLVIAALNNELEELREEQTYLARRYAPKHPEVQSHEVQIAAVEKALVAEGVQPTPASAVEFGSTPRVPPGSPQ